MAGGGGRWLRSKRSIAAAIAASLVIAGVAFALVQFPTLVTTVNVQEPISISPSNQTVSMFAGECINIDYTIHNAGNGTIVIDAIAACACVLFPGRSV